MKVVRSSLLLAIIVGVSLLVVPGPAGLGVPGCTNPVTTAGAESCDGSVGAFTLTLTDVVGITVTGTVTNDSITRAALNNRFLPLTSGVNVEIFAVTDYKVFGSVVITNGTTSGTFVADNVLQVDLGAFTGADDTTTDDPVDDTAAGCVITSVSDSTTCTTLPEGAAGAPSGVGVQLWHGGNTLGGTLQSHKSPVAFRIDKDALGNASTNTVATANVFNFVVTFRVLEV